MKKFLLVSFLLVGSLMFVGTNLAVVQQTLPAGGNSFETAVKLEPGNYKGGATVEDQELYYYVQVKAGQQLKSKLKLEGALWNMAIFDENKEEITSDFGDDLQLDWLTNADKSLYKYYIKISSNEWEVDSFSLEISLLDYYDAGSQTDAGDNFDKALSIVSGDYEGYLGGDYGIASWSGDDYKDYYKIPVKKGITYRFQITPPSNEQLALELLNLNRESIEKKESSNPGGIVTLSLIPSVDTDIFLLVTSREYGNFANAIVNYKLSIESTVPLTKFYVCEGANCKLTGEFSSLSDCQKSTAKTCYQASNCDGQCGIITPPPQCAKDSDCPAGYTCLEKQCVLAIPQCVKDSDCPVGTVCQNKMCVKSGVCQNECQVDQTKCFDNFNYHKCGNYDDDECLEWSTPVYCGEGNKCEGGECVEATDCQCSAWIDEGCAGNDCGENEIYQTRTCTPASCDSEEQCLADPTCIIIPIGCVSDSECENGLVCQEGMCVYKENGEEGEVWKTFSPMIFGALFSGWHFWLYLVLTIAFYIYFAICLQTLAKKTNTSNGWLAWIPVANIFLMIQIAQKPLWWFILLLIPIVNIVIGVILWMKIAERRGKPNWLGILIIVPVVGIIIPGYLAFSGKEKIEITQPYTGTGTQEANKPVVGYKHPCKYCEKLIPPNSTVCPFCGKANPLGPYRCPKCHEPIEKEWQACPKCNQNLRIICPNCGKTTFFGDHCEDCGARLLVKCPNCGQEQPPLSDNCIKCGKPLIVEKR